MFGRFLKKSYPTSGGKSSFDLEGYLPLPVAYQLRGTLLRKIRRGEPLLPEIDGREETKADVVRALLSGAHPYLISEEGTGKTRLARSLTRLLPRVPFIRGCPYHDDPKWPREFLCPRCRGAKDPVKEFGIDFIPGSQRFSRIQGNEYTNEAKLLGLKDIQAIAKGSSPSDPRVFTGTGVFRANRGILFVDELPAIRTKVQVLLHPILEEKKAILEEYNWEHPLDLVLIATGNPRGFAHVNEIPRPLLDRLEPIYMDLPEEEVERQIMLQETFKIRPYVEPSSEEESPYPTLGEIERRAIVPWWIVDLLNKSVRYSRICPYVEKKASIRASNKALDHTYASVELENQQVANLRHAYYGLRLALRGRVGLRADLIDLDNPKKTFKLGDELTADFLWNVLEDLKDGSLLGEYNSSRLAQDLASLFSESNLPPGRLPNELLNQYQELAQLIQQMKRKSEEVDHLPKDQQAQEEANFSALEFLANLALHQKTLERSRLNNLFVPEKFGGRR
ncbi:MAG: hypothetical protein DRI26_02370 [Chloroflexi bacterium]|nr:MAG: hypothetical protein DRI26_02370 [Chloroflexota bacterium]